VSAGGHSDTPHADRDTPLGGLPAAQRILLRNHAIELAALEIRFTGRGDAPTAAHGLALRDAARTAGIALDRVEMAERQDVSLTFTPGAGQTSTTDVTRGWQLFSADQRLAVTFMPDILIVQNTRYERYSASLGEVLAALLPAIVETSSPDLVQRIGLRYINRLSDPSARTPAAWRDRIAPEALGLLNHSQFGEQITSMQQQVELRLEESSGALIRHGTFQDPSSQGAYSYLLDVDVYDNSSERFVPTAICDRARRLNRTSLSLFQQLVLSAYRETMDPYEPSDMTGEST
jgi:uncharacterized protein (TIGR04255 family)